MGSTTCGSSEPSDIEIRTYVPGDAAMPGLHRVEHAAAEVVAEPADRRELGGQALDDRDRRVLVEVVDDEDLVRRGDGRGHARRTGSTVALLEDGHHDRERRRSSGSLGQAWTPT